MNGDLKNCKTCKGTGEEKSGVCYCGIAMTDFGHGNDHCPTEMTRPCPDCIRVSNLTGKEIDHIFWKENGTCMVAFTDECVAILTLCRSNNGSMGSSWNWYAYENFKEIVMEEALHEPGYGWRFRPLDADRLQDKYNHLKQQAQRR